MARYQKCDIIVEKKVWVVGSRGRLFFRPTALQHGHVVSKDNPK